MGAVPQPRIVVDDELVLRPWTRSDTPVVIAAFTTADIQHWHFRRYETIVEAASWIDDGNDGWRAESQASWAIARSDTDGAIGRVAIYPNLVDGYGEISYWVLPEARGAGTATRAAVAATRWAHDLGLHRVELQHSIMNEASGRVARGAGFTSEGIRRGSNLHGDGWHDMHQYAHLATDPI